MSATPQHILKHETLQIISTVAQEKLAANFRAVALDEATLKEKVMNGELPPNYAFFVVGNVPYKPVKGNQYLNCARKAKQQTKQPEEIDESQGQWRYFSKPGFGYYMPGYLELYDTYRQNRDKSDVTQRNHYACRYPDYPRYIEPFFPEYNANTAPNKTTHIMEGPQDANAVGRLFEATVFNEQRSISMLMALGSAKNGTKYYDYFSYSQECQQRFPTQCNAISYPQPHSDFSIRTSIMPDEWKGTEYDLLSTDNFEVRYLKITRSTKVQMSKAESRSSYDDLRTSIGFTDVSISSDEASEDALSILDDEVDSPCNIETREEVKYAVLIHVPNWEDHKAIASLTAADYRFIHALFNSNILRAQHCSAGLGRAGTLGFAEYLYEHYDEIFTGSDEQIGVNIANALHDFRTQTQRPGMIQTPEQLTCAIQIAAEVMKIQLQQQQLQTASEQVAHENTAQVVPEQVPSQAPQRQAGEHMHTAVVGSSVKCLQQLLLDAGGQSGKAGSSKVPTRRRAATAVPAMVPQCYSATPERGLSDSNDCSSMTMFGARGAREAAYGLHVGEAGSTQNSAGSEQGRQSPRPYDTAALFRAANAVITTGQQHSQSSSASQFSSQSLPASPRRSTGSRKGSIPSSPLRSSAGSDCAAEERLNRPGSPVIPGKVLS